MSVLVDARGCLTAAGLSTLQQAAPGAAPPELARHVAECARCQARLLTADLGPRTHARTPPSRGAGAPGRLWRPLAFVAAILVLALTALALLHAVSN